jgi:[ribosomal protein S5]-alanine N-acetyltransferase
MSLFETERLLICEANRKDSPFFFELLNSPNWIEFIGDRGIETENDVLNYIENSLIKSYKENGFGLYKMMLKENSMPIGICGFVQRDYLNCPDIGFAILPEYERMGFTFEAAKAVIDYGLNTLKQKEICGITTENNVGSKRILTKIGLHEIGKIMPNESGDELMLFSNLEETKAY